MARGDGRQKILIAAIAALAKEGRAGVRVDGIAADAGINKRMIYHYFGDREGLIDAVIESQVGIIRTSDVSDELKLLVGRLYANTNEMLQRPEPGLLTTAFQIVIREAIGSGSTRGFSDESEHLLTNHHMTTSAQRRVADELMTYLFPHLFRKARKPVFRLQSDSRERGE